MILAMKFTIKNLAKSQIEINFELPYEDLKSFKKQALLELGANLKVEGFRPGHVPEEIIEREVGQEAILNEAAEHAIRENYKKTISDNKIVSISQPKVEILKLAAGNPFEFKILVSVLPEVKLPDYKKIAGAVKRKKVFVEEKEIENSLAWLQKSRAKFTLKNEPAEKGDFVQIEYSSAQLEDGKQNQDAFILGEGRFVKGFEENLYGMKDGEEKEFPVQFPKDYIQKILAGKNVDFKIRMKSVQKMELPEINDEFIKGLGSFENLTALRQNIKQGVALEKEREEADRIRAEILDKISEASVCEIPEVLLESEKKRTPDLPQEQAKKRVMNSLVLREIGRRENVKVSDEEIKEETDRFLRQYPGIKTAENQFDAERLKEYIKDAIANEKIIKLLESLDKTP